MVKLIAIVLLLQFVLHQSVIQDILYLDQVLHPHIQYINIQGQQIKMF